MNKLILAVLLSCVSAFAQQTTQLSEAPAAASPTQELHPFGITVLAAERAQTRQTKPLLIETVVGAGLSYRFLNNYSMTANLNYGVSLQTGNQSLMASLSYRIVQFGKKRKEIK